MVTLFFQLQRQILVGNVDWFTLEAKVLIKEDPIDNGLSFSTNDFQGLSFYYFIQHRDLSLYLVWLLVLCFIVVGCASFCCSCFIDGFLFSFCLLRLLLLVICHCFLLCFLPVIVCVFVCAYVCVCACPLFSRGFFLWFCFHYCLTTLVFSILNIYCVDCCFYLVAVEFNRIYFSLRLMLTLSFDFIDYSICLLVFLFLNFQKRICFRLFQFSFLSNAVQSYNKCTIITINNLVPVSLLLTLNTIRLH